MTTTSKESLPAAPVAKDLSTSMLTFLEIVGKRWKFLVRFVLFCTLAAIILALLTPKSYKAEATVFPAESTDLFSGLEGVASLARSFSPSRALTSLSGNPDADRYMAILKSSTLLDSVIARFDLVHVYDITSYLRERSQKELLENLSLSLEPEGNIIITVYDRDPQRAADMANYFVDMLNSINSQMQVQNARGNRIFIENRYNKNLADLRTAEDSLKAFQMEHGIIAMPEQTEASIKAAAQLAGQLALREVEVGVLRRTQSADNPSVKTAQIEVDEMRKHLAEMNAGTGVAEGEMKVFVPFKLVPSLGSEYVRRFRDVEIQYKILQFITPLYEQAKVEERRNTPSVVVLDRAVPAERKAKPKISLYALLGFVSSLLIGLLAVFCIEAVRRLRETDPGRFQSALSMVRADWFGLHIYRRRR